jgi:hypothetical protein
MRWKERTQTKKKKKKQGRAKKFAYEGLHLDAGRDLGFLAYPLDLVCGGGIHLRETGVVIIVQRSQLRRCETDEEEKERMEKRISVLFFFFISDPCGEKNEKKGGFHFFFSRGWVLTEVVERLHGHLNAGFGRGRLGCVHQRHKQTR